MDVPLEVDVLVSLRQAGRTVVPGAVISGLSIGGP